MLLVKMGVAPEDAVNEATMMLAAADEDGNGEIEFHEFAQIWQRKLLAVNDQYIRDIFTVLDENGDGNIDAKELAKVLNGEEDEIREYIKEVDTDGDGMLSFQEFKRAMKEGTSISAHHARRRSFFSVHSST